MKELIINLREGVLIAKGILFFFLSYPIIKPAVLVQGTDGKLLNEVAYGLVIWVA